MRLQTLSTRALPGRLNRHSLILLACGGAVGGSAATVVHPAGDRVASGREPTGIEHHRSARTDDLATVGAPGVGERIAIGIAGHRGDVYAFADQHRAAISRTSHHRRAVGPRLDPLLHSAIGGIALAIIRSGGDGVAP